MDYKEKYEQALEVAQRFYNNSVAITKKGLEDMFPELKESEDERIRKDLIVFVKGSISDKGSEQRKAYISWLEKHREPVEINPTEFDTRLQALIGKFDSLPKEELIGSLSFWLNVVQNDGTYKDEEKQGEQKPADKVEPKFKVGDIIRLRGSAAEYTIKKVTDTTYYTDGWSCGIERCEEDYELVEQKTDWSDKNEAVLDALIRRLEGEDIYVSPHLAAECIKSLKDRVLPQQKQVWSEEDEKQARQIERIVHNDGCSQKLQEQIADWLESLKNRVLPQSKKEWSEEDKIKETIRCALLSCCNGSAINYKLPYDGYEKCLSWLKSLRPHWKPSELQLECLDDAIKHYQSNGSRPVILMELLEELKKL